MELQIFRRLRDGGVAREHVNLFPECECARRNGSRALAVEGAIVKAALACDDKIRCGQPIFEIEPGGNEIEARNQLCACRCH